MSREQERIKRKLENNPVIECNKIRQKYCPKLFQDFASTKDPRHQSYTEYSNRELLGTVFYKGIAGIESMQSMTYEFNKERVSDNLFHYLMIQIADMVKQLYEWLFLKKNGIKKKQKNISSDLSESFAQQLTREDISANEEGITFKIPRKTLDKASLEGQGRI